MRVPPVAIRLVVAVLALLPIAYGINAALRPRAERFARLSEHHFRAAREALEEFAPLFGSVNEKTRDAWALMADNDFADELGRRGGRKARKAAKRSRYHLRLAYRYQDAARFPFLHLNLPSGPLEPK